jgi:hypothetical protein
LGLSLGGLVLAVLSLSANGIQMLIGHTRADKTAPLFLHLGLVFCASTCLLALLPKSGIGLLLLLLLVMVSGGGPSGSDTPSVMSVGAAFAGAKADPPTAPLHFTMVEARGPGRPLWKTNLLERFGRDELVLEIEAGVVGGEEDGVKASGAAKLYTTPEDTLEVAARLNAVQGARYLRRGDVRQCPRRLQTGPRTVETIDPETCEVLSPGEEGELVFTPLTRDSMPLLRYRTRDISVIEIDKCACGRTHSRMMKVLGRSDDMLKIRGVNVFPSQIEAALMKVKGVSDNYQIVKTKQGDIIHLSIEVEPNEERWREGI